VRHPIGMFSCFSSASTKAANARAFAVGIWPVGKTAHRSSNGSDQSVSTARTSPEASSGANFQAETMANPIFARTADRTPSAELTRSGPEMLTETSVDPWRKRQIPPSLA
jgi:hypothetical protein